MRFRRFSVLNIFMLSSFFVFCSSAFASSDINKLCLSSTSPEGNQIVDNSCPIGEGLWGRKPAKNGDFWVQCGIYSELPDKNGKANEVLYRKEGSQYRCLAGPYDSFGDAKNARDKLRKNAEMSDAFIRQIGFKPSVKKRSSKTTVQVSKSGVVRQQEEVLGLWAPKPQGMDVRYTVNRRDWWRATYEDASNACRQNGKKLVSERSLRNAISTSHGTEVLPDLYPYWLSDGQVYDIKLDMSFVAISDTLTLNVLCE